MTKHTSEELANIRKSFGPGAVDALKSIEHLHGYKVTVAPKDSPMKKSKYEREFRVETAASKTYITLGWSFYRENEYSRLQRLILHVLWWKFYIDRWRARTPQEEFIHRVGARLGAHKLTPEEQDEWDTLFTPKGTS